MGSAETNGGLAAASRCQSFKSATAGAEAFHSGVSPKHASALGALVTGCQ